MSKFKLPLFDFHLKSYNSFLPTLSFHLVVELAVTSALLNAATTWGKTTIMEELLEIKYKLFVFHMWPRDIKWLSLTQGTSRGKDPGGTRPKTLVFWCYALPSKTSFCLWKENPKQHENLLSRNSSTALIRRDRQLPTRTHLCNMVSKLKWLK